MPSDSVLRIERQCLKAQPIGIVYYVLTRHNEESLFAMNQANKYMGQYWRSQDILLDFTAR